MHILLEASILEWCCLSPGYINFVFKRRKQGGINTNSSEM